MHVFIMRLNQPDIVFEDAQRSNGIRIQTSDGATYAITELPGGALSVSESTHRHLTISPRATNAAELRAVEPEHFKIKEPSRGN